MCEQQPVVFDNGSGFLKAGFAGDNNTNPSVIFPSVVGKVRFPFQMVGMDYVDTFIGNDVDSKEHFLIIKRAIEHGVMKWDEMETIWNYTFKTLNVNPVDQPILLAESPRISQESSEKMTQIMFETFETPAFFLGNQASLSLLASGQTTGVIVDSGYDNTYVVPIYEGCILSEKITRSNLAGARLTALLKTLITDENPDISNLDIKEFEKMKLQLCEIRVNNTIDYSSKTFSLPDGNTISLSKERFMCPESLFEPKSISIFPESTPGIHEIVNCTVEKCPTDIQKELFRNVVLVGGSTMFPGFGERMQNDLRALTKNCDIKVNASNNRQYLAWNGGSMLASRSDFESMCISRDDYEEVGPSIIATLKERVNLKTPKSARK